jgi:hypothetical protein
LEKLSSILKQQNINSSALDERIQNYKIFLQENPEYFTDFRKVIHARNVSNTTKMHIEIEAPRDLDLMTDLYSYLRFSFPTFANMEKDLVRPNLEIPVDRREKPEGMLIDDRHNGRFFVYGKYDDLYKFGKILSNTGWDVTEYRQAFIEIQKVGFYKSLVYKGRLMIYCDP